MWVDYPIKCRHQHLSLAVFGELLQHTYVWGQFRTLTTGSEEVSPRESTPQGYHQWRAGWSVTRLRDPLCELTLWIAQSVADDAPLPPFQLSNTAPGYVNGAVTTAVDSPASARLCRARSPDDISRAAKHMWRDLDVWLRLGSNSSPATRNRRRGRRAASLSESIVVTYHGCSLSSVTRNPRKMTCASL